MLFKFLKKIPPIIKLIRKYYHISRLSGLPGALTQSPNTVVIVLPPEGSGGWILDRIGKEIYEAMSAKNTKVIRFGDSIPENTLVFFTHYNFFIESLLLDRNFAVQRRCFVYFTHFENRKHNLTDQIIACSMRRVCGIVCMNSGLKRKLATLGVPDNKLHVLVAGANAAQFVGERTSSSGKKKVCMVSAYYPRKNPELILELVKMRSDLDFFLLGPNWDAYSGINRLLNAPNFKWLELEYSEYGDFYRQMDVFFSPSFLEGGPIPLIEALMSGVPSVVSETGFGRDVIENGENGFVFPINTSPLEISEMIDKATLLHVDREKIVKNNSWSAFSEKVVEIMKIKNEPAFAERN
jgi:glycosyltransferase involved in cell wall biosynthesis